VTGFLDATLIPTIVAGAGLLGMALLWDHFARAARKVNIGLALAPRAGRETRRTVTIPAQRTSPEGHAGLCDSCSHPRTIRDGAVFCSHCTTDPTSTCWTSPYKGGEVA
jgi:hypothetical protein